MVVAILLCACAAPIPSTAGAPTPSPPSATASPPASPQPASSGSATASLSSEALRAAVDAPAIRTHLEELQRIADANGGNRATGTSGFDASVAYVAAQLEAAGYEPVQQTFAVAGTTSRNVVAERHGTGDEILVVGAHLDSVPAGPGINDNGSGVATLLVIAARLAELRVPDRSVRFAFWGAEEGGPFGSQAYVDQLQPRERARIVAYLNFDMLGSPNFVRFAYAEAGAAPGSDELTAVLSSYFEGAGLAWEPIDLTGHSDHGAFAAAGIPTGGLFSGGREPKTDAQAAAFGGTAGSPADPCSDAACDTLANVSDLALDQMSDAAAHAIATLASTVTSE